MKEVYVESNGDPDVGILPQFAKIVFDDLEFITDDDLREFTRKQLRAAFQDIWDDGSVKVWFEDEEITP